MVYLGLPVYVDHPARRWCSGILAGLVTAFLVAQLGIPSFVATLAGWLIYRGALLLVTLKTGTIIIDEQLLQRHRQRLRPRHLPESSTFLPEVHKLTLLLGLLAILLVHLQPAEEPQRSKAPTTSKSCPWTSSS